MIVGPVGVGAAVVVGSTEVVGAAVVVGTAVVGGAAAVLSKPLNIHIINTPLFYFFMIFIHYSLINIEFIF